MKKSEFRKLIQEEVRKVVKEAQKSEDGKSYIGKTIKDILTDFDGENQYIMVVMTDGSKMEITAFPAGENGVGIDIS